MKRITDWVHEGLRGLLKPGDWVVDATLGNGHDAEFLLDCVAPGGRVFGFDVQEDAIARSLERLKGAAEFLAFRADHRTLGDHLPAAAERKLKAVVFNLGYLPGGDHGLVTRAESTLPALEVALERLATGGVLSCTCYPGSPEGATEARAVSTWFEGVEPSVGFVSRIESMETLQQGPFTLWLEKR